MPRLLMSLCSRHQHPEPGCDLCQARPEDIFPDWEEKLQDARSAGLERCACGFEYYRTTDRCPLCGRARPEVHPSA